MEHSTSVIILTLSHRLRQLIDTLTENNASWKVLPESLIEWIIQKSIHREEIALSETFQEIYQTVLRDFAEYFDRFDRHDNIQKVEWKGNELWVHTSSYSGKNFPDWSKIEKISIPDVKDRDVEGVVIFNPKGEKVYYSDVTRMPKHATVQVSDFLKLGVHTSPVLQKAYDNTEEKRIESRFLWLKDPSDSWAISKTFSYWWKDTRQGYPTVVTRDEDSYGGEKQSRSQWKDKTKRKGSGNQTDTPNYAKRVRAGKREYTNPFKCGRGEHIETREVYARIFSKLDKWKDWHFV